MTAGKAKNGIGKTMISGKIERMDRFDSKDRNRSIFQTIILRPAESEYDYPARFCVKSEQPLGSPDQVVSVECNIVCRPWRDRTGLYRYPHDLWVSQ